MQPVSPSNGYKGLEKEVAQGQGRYNLIDVRQGQPSTRHPLFLIPMRHLNPSKEITIEYPSGLKETAKVVLSDPACGDLIVNEEGELKRYGNTGKDKTASCGFWFAVGRSRYWFEFLGSYKA